MLARGASPWNEEPISFPLSPNGAAVSIPHVPFVVTQPVTSEQRDQFIPIRRSPVMCGLVFDVATDPVALRITHGEGRVSALPREAGSIGECLVDPAGTARFDLS